MIKGRKELYPLFEEGKIPSEGDFKDLIDSVINIEEDGIRPPIAKEMGDMPDHKTVLSAKAIHAYIEQTLGLGLFPARYIVVDPKIVEATGVNSFNTINACLDYIKEDPARKGKIYILPKGDGSAWKENICLKLAEFDWSHLEIELDNASALEGADDVSPTIEIRGKDQDLCLKNIRIKANINNNVKHQKQGVYCEYASLKIDGNILNCTSQVDGGGLYAIGSTLHIGDIENCSTTQKGGGFYVSDSSLTSGSILSCTSEDLGGGFYVAVNSRVTTENIKNCLQKTSEPCSFSYENNVIVRFGHADKAARSAVNKDERESTLLIGMESGVPRISKNEKK